jgi:DNA-binding NarL/FixJ family response regulator
LTETPQANIRTLCVDDQAVVRRGVALVLMAHDDVELVGEAESGEEALALCEMLRPDVVLMDIVMPGMGGLAATRAIRQRWPATYVVGITSFVQPGLLDEMRRAGATQCLSKNGSSDELIQAIRSAYRAGRGN